MEITELTTYLQSNNWKTTFSSTVLTNGLKLARSKAVTSTKAEILPTGDVEIVANIIEKSGQQEEAIIAFWQENNNILIDASCSCDVAQNCIHCAATLEYLAKAERLATAFGQTPHIENIQKGQKLNINLKPKTQPTNNQKPTTDFLLRIERRPESKSLTHLPEIYAQPYAIYGNHQVPLDPTGNLRPIVTPETKIHRNREAEMLALQTLYALDLLPLKSTTAYETLYQPETEKPTHFLKTPPPNKTQIAPPWAPDKKQWPHPHIYWQRFRHEATPALESRGWKVRFATHTALQPLIFKADTWRAEMVEEAKGWFNLSAGFEIDGESFSLQPILTALLNNNFLEATENMPGGQEFMIFLPDGRGLALPVGRFRHILKTLGEILDFKFSDGPIKLSKLQATLLEADEEIEIDSPTDIEQIAERIKNPQKIQNLTPPASLQAKLRDYQHQGYCWMQFLARSEFNGILADDMGLGKTLQTLTHILTEKENNQSQGKPTLVLAPTSVVKNWQRESAKFTPTLKTLILQGTNRHHDFKKIPTHDIILTSYALIHRDLDHHLPIHYHLIALDEAQHIKNATAQTSQAVRKLTSTHRLCLSGTPIENNLGELWSLFAFLMPGLLNKKSHFTETYQTPIEKNHDEEKRNALNRIVGPLILRRTKNDVAKELPPKTEIIHNISLTEEQKDLYETVRSSMDKHVRQAIIARGGQAQIVFLDALLKLRQICNHPDLIKTADDDQPTSNLKLKTSNSSAKFEYLKELLETLLAENHRVLIFSQFTSMLAIIEQYLISQNISYLILTGATKDRQSLVERFQSGEAEVFLISLKAGGTGLTLTGADNVIHYDPWWNPAAENQATDRAYRIGQDKPVFVHKLICENTVEQRIQQMQSKKNTLSNNILDGSTQTIELNEATLNDILS